MSRPCTVHHHDDILQPPHAHHALDSLNPSTTTAYAMPPTQLTPLTALRTTTHQIPAHPASPSPIPNTSLTNRPLLIYHNAFPAPTTPAAIESHLTRLAVVRPAWRYTMYSTSHFHSTTHEILIPYVGAARCRFGGDGNPGAVDVEIGEGDVVVVPAGVAHRLLEVTTPGFAMVGSYPVGAREWDMCYGREGEVGVVERIARLEWFKRDPVYGNVGPVLDV